MKYHNHYIFLHESLHKIQVLHKEAFLLEPLGKSCSQGNLIMDKPGAAE